MSKFSKFLITTAVAAVVLPSAAMAAPVTGTSTGAFSSSDCNGSSFCQFDSSVANGTNSEFQWGADTQNQDPSTLTADKVAIGTFSIATSNVVIAKLTWLNTPINSDNGRLNSIDVDYKLTISFSSPGSSPGGSETFDLDILNTTNDSGDIISTFTAPDLTTLQNSINAGLSGWTVSGLAYSVDGTTVHIDGHNETASFGGSCGANQWCNPEGATSDLFITANFTPVAAPTGVPEPMTLSLFGAGLAGAAAMRLRRRKKA